MIPLIDADVLRYEVGAIGQTDDEIKSFEFVAEVLDGRIRDICLAVGATQPPVLYLTGGNNFRDAIAVTKPYKGNRKSEKPYHFDNITAYMKAVYNTVEAEGIEADDAMSIRQMQEGDTVICTRDKDLRMVPGWHYGWECGAQHEYRLRYIEDPGWLELDKSGSSPKITGGGILFFYSQLLTGDSVDNIPGLPQCGPVRAFTVLQTDDPWSVVKEEYEKKGMGDDYLLEQGQLLWMIRELDKEGRPVMWQFPE